jgi:hypothetical protein
MLEEDSANVERTPRGAQRLERAGVLQMREAINAGHGRVKIVEPAAESFELRARF